MWFRGRPLDTSSTTNKGGVDGFLLSVSAPYYFLYNLYSLTRVLLGKLLREMS